MLAAASLVAAAGCGSSGGTTSGSAATPPPTGSADGGGVASGSGASRPAEKNERSALGQGESRRDGRSEESSSDGGGALAGGAGSDATKRGDSSTAAARAARQCPATLTRAQCAARVKAMSEKTASYPVSKPSDCLEGQSRDECKAKAVAQQGADGSQAASVSPEECLQVYSRERCEALYGERARAQAALQEAGE